jgi:iron complex transport system substrate-binding protein
MKGMKTLRSGRNRRKWIYVLLLMGLLGLSGCGSPSSASVEMSSQTELVKTGSMELQYAENFAVDYYEDGYKMLTTLPDSKRYLIVPEGQPVPRGLDEDVSILQEPLQNIYLVASGAMDMFASLDAVDQIRFSGQKQENWYIQTAKDAMAAGDMIYAGKYSKPDYELLVSEGCDLAIENRMITHSPEVVEMLQSFDIPVMIEYSSYEQHPLGKVEWVKFFGALTGKEAEAEEAFAEQTEILEKVESGEKNREDHSIFLCDFQRTDPGTAEHGLYSEADRTGRGKIHF